MLFRFIRTRHLAMLLGGILLLGAAAERFLSVKVRSAALRSRPSFLGRKLASLPYGTEIKVLQRKGSWVEVLDRAKHRGWVHLSAVTRRKILMRPGSEPVSPTASREELTLATKGFDEQVERNYRKRKQTLDFRWVDWMEKVQVSMEAVQRFLREGNLVPREDFNR